MNITLNLYTLLQDVTLGVAIVALGFAVRAVIITYKART